MKKLLYLMLTVLVCVLMVVPAMAEAVGMPTDFMSWDALATFAGSVAMVVFIVQAAKMPLDRVFGHVPTRVVVYVISFAVQLCARWIIAGTMDFETVCMCVFNAVLVMLAAMATYTEYVEKVEARKLVVKYTPPAKADDAEQETTDDE